MMSANVIKGIANAMTAQGHHHKGKRPSFFSYSSRRFSSVLSIIRGENKRMCVFMLVDSERNLLITHCLHFTRKNNVGSAQEVQLVFVRGDGVQGLGQKLFELCHISLLRLDSFLMLDESFE